MKILVIADALETLKPKGDTSLMLMQAAIEKSWDVFFCTEFEIFHESPHVYALASAAGKFKLGDKPALSTPKKMNLDAFDSVWIRKDPPFDNHYVKLCWLLQLVKSECRYLNHPTLLLNHHEKLLASQAVAEGFLTPKDIIPTFIGSFSEAQNHVRKSSVEAIITKPFLGYGGKGIRQWTRDEFLEFESDDLQWEDVVVQPFVSEIATTGDRRVFFVHGKDVGGFVRIPADGKIASNIAQGGKPLLRDYTDAETQVIQKTGSFLKKLGVVFAGADFIGHRLSEINITSPTGLYQALELTGTNHAHTILDSL